MLKSGWLASILPENYPFHLNISNLSGCVIIGQPETFLQPRLLITLAGLLGAPILQTPLFVVLCLYNISSLDLDWESGELNSSAHICTLKGEDKRNH